MFRNLVQVFAVVCFCTSFSAAPTRPPVPSDVAIDAEVSRIMSATHANGIGLAVVDGGNVRHVRAYGLRNKDGQPLTTDTVMYGASLTKTVFAYAVMRLVDRGKLNLDTPLRDYLDNPLPSYPPDPVFPDKYGPYKHLAEDSRW